MVRGTRDSGVDILLLGRESGETCGPSAGCPGGALHGGGGGGDAHGLPVSQILITKSCSKSDILSGCQSRRYTRLVGG